MRNIYLLLTIWMSVTLSPSHSSPFKKLKMIQMTNPLVRNNDDEITVTTVHNNLKDLEKSVKELEERFNQSMEASMAAVQSDNVGNFEGHLNDLQEQLQGLMSLTSRVETIEKEVAVSVTKSDLYDRDSKMNMESEEKIKMLEKLRSEVEGFKTQIQGTEKKFADRIVEFQGQLTELTRLKEDNKKTKQSMTQMEGRLQTVETQLSSDKEVKSVLDNFEAKMNADTKENMKLIKTLQADVGTFKTRIQGTEEKFEGRMKEIQGHLEGLTSLKADDKKEEENKESRLETVEKELSSVSVVKSALDDLKSKVTADAKENKNIIENLKTEVGEFKTQIQRNEKAFESRMEKMEDKLEGVTSLQEEYMGTKRKVELMENRLKTVENGLSSVSEVKSDLGDLKAKVTADSEKEKKAIENLQVDVGGFKTQIQGTEGKMTKVKEEVQSLTHLHCPPEYVYKAKANICIRNISSLMTSEDAEKHCKETVKRGSLVILNTKERLEAVQEYLREQGVKKSVYVGGRKVDKDYQWLNGEKVDGPWCPGQPGSKSCLGLWSAKGFCLDDVWCSTKKPFVCQVTLDD